MKNLKFIILFSIILVFTQCQKTYEARVIGTWKHGNINDVFENTVWIFHEDGILEVINDPNCNIIDTCIGTYTIESNFHIPYIIVENLGSPLNGTYQAEQFKNEILIMTRRKLENDSTPGAYLRREFLKQ